MTNDLYSTKQAAEFCECAISTFLIRAKRAKCAPVKRRVRKTTGWFWQAADVQKCATISI